MAEYALITIGGSPELQRRQMNVNFELLRNSVGGYGSMLPDPDTVLEGALFNLSGVFYQLQAGVWVLAP